LRRLDRIGEFIARDNPGAADRVIARVVAAVDRLAEQPALGRVGRIEGTREMAFADIPYIVTYRVTAVDVVVLTIMHTSQKWPENL
jgi:toxin ParE1/3/4